MTFSGPSPWRARVRWTLLWSAFAAVIFAGFTARPAQAPLDEDELYWIGSTYFFQLARQGEWAHPHWQLLPARENPPLAKYVLGLGLASTGQAVTTVDLLGTFYLLFERTPGAWGRDAEYAKRAAVVQQMTPAYREALRGAAQARLEPRVILAARRTSVACAVLLSFTVFVLGARCHSALGGLIASGLVSLHPAVIHAYNHAHADAVALAAAGLAALSGCELVRALRAGSTSGRAGQRWRAVALGAALALACAAKMNAIVLLLVTAAVLGLLLLRHARRDPKQVGNVFVAGVIVLVTAPVVFIGLNPTLWADVGGGLVATVREHRLTEAIQAAFLPHHLTALSEKFSAVARLSAGGSVVLVALTAVALAALRSPQIGTRGVALWFLIALGCVTAWIPFAFSRYVLPLVLPGAILLGFLSAEALQRVRHRMSGASLAGMAQESRRPAE